jgi:hypothetical protein
MNHLGVSIAGLRSLVGGLVVAATMLGGARDAQASTELDKFNGPWIPGTQWSFLSSNPSHSNSQILNNSTFAHSAPNFAWENLDAATTAGDWIMAYRTFNAPSAAPVKSCSALIFIRPFVTESISVQMVNPNNWTYIGVSTSNFVNASCSNPEPMTCYTHLPVSNSFPCSNSIQLRVVLSGGSGGSRLAYIDDVSVTFNQ